MVRGPSLRAQTGSCTVHTDVRSGFLTQQWLSTANMDHCNHEGAVCSPVPYGPLHCFWWQEPYLQAP